MEPDYIVAVYYNGEARRLSHSDKTLPIDTDVRFLIRCEYLRSGRRGQPNYYRNTVYKDFVPVDDNTFSWEGINCRIIPEEVWGGDVKGAWILMEAEIVDKLQVLRVKKFDNELHNGSAFSELFAYLNDLKSFCSHQAVEEYYRRVNIE